jgi:Zn-dependent peptidase ImmA (M78 family)
VRLVATSIARLFGVSPMALFGERGLLFPSPATAMARFKVSASAEATKLSAYSVYAHYLGLTLINATPKHHSRVMPPTCAEFRNAVVDAYGSLTFESTLRFAWDCGIIVLPLNDSGAFHGACWRIKGRHVIVLKQKHQSVALWFFDLLHELRHTVQEASDPQFSVIEAEETSLERRDSPYERDADHFAANVLLDDKANELAKQCVSLAHGKIPLLKSVVPKVARQAGVDVGALANYIAYRLTRQDSENWWGAANNLQPSGPNPWKTARDIFLEKVDLCRINPVDRELVIRALNESEVAV